MSSTPTLPSHGAMPEVDIDVRGHSLWITINREHRRNALNATVIRDIHAAVRHLIELDAEDPAARSFRAVVLTGAGRKAFCAGADLGDGPAVFADHSSEPTTDFGRLARTFRELGIPTIARINGDCIAGGMALMALCDLAIVADHARFGLPEAKVGVFPMQVLVYLRHLIPRRLINQLCLTGEMLGAQRAYEIGLVNEIAPYEDLDARVEALVAKLTLTSPAAIKRGKYAIAAMESMNHAEALAFAETQIAVASRTDDAREGMTAFVEKRSPGWVPKGETK